MFEWSNVLSGCFGMFFCYECKLFDGNVCIGCMKICYWVGMFCG